MNKRISILLIALLAVVQTFGLNFTASVTSNSVAVGERFRITFAADASIDNFRAPTFDGFQILSGPNQSTSMQLVNGSFSTNISYSYILVANKTGSLTIEPAKCIVDGKK